MNIRSASRTRLFFVAVTFIALPCFGSHHYGTQPLTRENPKNICELKLRVSLEQVKSGGAFPLSDLRTAKDSNLESAFLQSVTEMGQALQGVTKSVLPSLVPLHLSKRKNFKDYPLMKQKRPRLRIDEFTAAFSMSESSWDIHEMVNLLKVDERFLGGEDFQISRALALDAFLERRLDQFSAKDINRLFVGSRFVPGKDLDPRYGYKKNGNIIHNIYERETTETLVDLLVKYIAEKITLDKNTLSESEIKALVKLAPQILQNYVFRFYQAMNGAHSNSEDLKQEFPILDRKAGLGSMREILDYYYSSKNPEPY